MEKGAVGVGVDLVRRLFSSYMTHYQKNQKNQKNFKKPLDKRKKSDIL